MQTKKPEVKSDLGSFLQTPNPESYNLPPAPSRHPYGIVKIQVELTEELRKRIKRCAVDNSITMNQLVVNILEEKFTG